ncbi:50S ribosomal protein L35 [candidate division WOR-3 bacterium]|nr:50S ribosomal protein L35 [candidate division WOR-3 bacterium]
MRKQKTLSSLKKRMKRSAGGKYVHRPSGTSHNNACKGKARKRRLHTTVAVRGGLRRRCRRMLPHA